MAASQSEVLNSAWRDFAMTLFCGGSTGVIVKTIIAPLERVKILFQLKGMTDGFLPVKRKHPGIFSTGYRIAKEQGVRSLWRGNGANVLRVIPVYALKFGFNDSFRVLVAGEEAVKQRSLSFVQMMLSGTLAGLFQQMITYPLEVVRTRLSLGPGSGVEYMGISHCVSSMIKSEGRWSLYKGLGPTLLSGAPYVGIQMTTFDTMKSYLIRVDPFAENGVVSLPMKLLAGANAGLVAQTITYPGDTIRRRMQTNGANGSPRIYRNSWDCARQIYARDGLRGFYPGLSINVMRLIPGAAIQFVVYDYLKKLFDVYF